ncbi:hypothetical protein MNVI_17750 [Mycobacterium noviomagense]|uniref:Uncharacterized protein n=1 Tax=Mycobacterium noviomagense TaxID=459858 RepID=A0A7I7PCW2_9MYCO|nr:hypothetical protein MNVI_17750 [Mycobacterium noviomagense]
MFCCATPPGQIGADWDLFRTVFSDDCQLDYGEIGRGVDAVTDKGVDVLGLILGKTDTPALRRLEHSRGQISPEDETPPDAASVDEVISEAFDNLTNGPTWIVGENMRAAAQMLGSMTRNQAVQLLARASAAAMGGNK